MSHGAHQIYANLGKALIGAFLPSNERASDDVNVPEWRARLSEAELEEDGRAMEQSKDAWESTLPFALLSISVTFAP